MSIATSKQALKRLFAAPPLPSKKSSKQTSTVAPPDTDTNDGVTWGATSAILVAFAVFIAAQFIAAELISIYPALAHMNRSQATSWINASIGGQFFYYLFAESLTVGAILYFIRWRKGSLRAIGLTRPHLVDIPFVFVGFVIYFPALIIAVDVIEHIISGFNVNQQQALGFSTTTSGWALVLVFISLVILPPIAEEIMFRGFLYSGLKKSLPKIWAVLLTCALFASPHLLESTGGGPLWIAGVDTFILSLTLIWLREKTGRLYASMGLHGLKNFIAFIQLFPVFHIHL